MKWLEHFWVQVPNGKNRRDLFLKFSSDFRWFLSIDFFRQNLIISAFWFIDSSGSLCFHSLEMFSSGQAFRKNKKILFDFNHFLIDVSGLDSPFLLLLFPFGDHEQMIGFVWFFVLVCRSFKENQFQSQKRGKSESRLDFTDFASPPLIVVRPLACKVSIITIGAPFHSKRWLCPFEYRVAWRMIFQITPAIIDQSPVGKSVLLRLQLRKSFKSKSVSFFSFLTNMTSTFESRKVSEKIEKNHFLQNQKENCDLKHFALQKKYFDWFFNTQTQRKTLRNWFLNFWETLFGCSKQDFLKIKLW